MNKLAIQYLEDTPELDALTPGSIAEKLQQAADLLPLTHLLVGWRLSNLVLETCRREAGRMGAALYRWQPLLAGDGALKIYDQWKTVGLNGERVSGYQQKPEFTFLCPSHPEVQEAVQEHLYRIARSGIYQGLFLDRIRYPSPAANPETDLACFCKHCRQKAEAGEIDLEKIRRALARMAGGIEGKRELARCLLQPIESPAVTEETAVLKTFLKFRCEQITRFVQMAAELPRSQGLEIGLDCFSPALALMVGQDLAALGKLAGWVKVLTYAHTSGPAGLPFEFGGLANWLVGKAAMFEGQALDWLAESAELALPTSRSGLKEKGLPAQSLAQEVRRAVQTIPVDVLAGVELVELEGITRLDERQIEEDLEAVHSCRPAGLALSWDLWYMPLERLEQVQRVWRV